MARDKLNECYQHSNILRIFWKMAGALVILLAMVVLMHFFFFFFNCLTYGFDQTHVGQVGFDPCDELD